MPTTSAPTQASATLSVGQSVQASIVILDPTSNTPTPDLLQGAPFITRGAGLEAGKVTVYLDTATRNQELGSATVASDGSFQAKFKMPTGTGNQPHTILAVQTIHGGTTDASVNVMVRPRWARYTRVGPVLATQRTEPRHVWRTVCKRATRRFGHHPQPT
jgi:hypothetical protein